MGWVGSSLFFEMAGLTLELLEIKTTISKFEMAIKFSTSFKLSNPIPKALEENLSTKNRAGLKKPTLFGQDYLLCEVPVDCILVRLI